MMNPHSAFEVMRGLCADHAPGVRGTGALNGERERESAREREKERETERERERGRDGRTDGGREGVRKGASKKERERGRVREQIQKKESTRNKSTHLDQYAVYATYHFLENAHECVLSESEFCSPSFEGCWTSTEFYGKFFNINGLVGEFVK